MKVRWMNSGLGLGVLAMVFLALPGCGEMEGDTVAGRGAPGASPDPSKAPAEAAKPAEAAAVKLPSLASRATAPSDKGAIVGWVVYQGKPPKPKAINFGAEQVCGNMHKDHPPSYETLVVNPNSTVKGTLVALRGKFAEKYPPPAAPAAIDQVGCIFTPHVAAVMVGQDLELRNSDPVSHNIRSSAVKNLPFNNVFTSKSTSKVKFESPEIGVPLKCDIHFWMSSYVHVLDNPFFAITGDDGSFVIPDVPPGDYTLLAWHESLKSQTQPITVKAGEVKEVQFLWPRGK